MSPEGYAIIGALGGVAVTGVISIINNFINKRFEEKKQKKEAIIKIGLEYWSTLMNAPGQGLVGPPEQYIVHIACLMDAMLDDKFDKDRFIKAVRESQKFQSELAQAIAGQEQS